MSRYHRFTQNDGRGYMIIVQHADDPAKGIVATNLTAAQADVQLQDLRSREIASRAQA